jgi:hypothetical protein
VSRIIVSLHVEFDEADFPFSASPRPTNDLDIFETGKSTQWRLMVPLGFPPHRGSEVGVGEADTREGCVHLKGSYMWRDQRRRNYA